MAKTGSDTVALEPLKVADHVALDFLNTLMVAEGELTDVLVSDADVLRWLSSSGFPKRHGAKLPEGSLLQAARKLREALRTAVQQRKAGEAINWRGWNAWLAKAPSCLAVVEKDSVPMEERRWQADTPEQVLAPLAESAVELLVHGHFDLVRHCEGEQCVLWFYDRTKSHRRRWCSMSACGNRHKVAAYRERQQMQA